MYGIFLVPYYSREPRAQAAFGAFLFIWPGARVYGGYLFCQRFPGSARSRYALRVSSFARVRPLAPKSGVLSGLRLRAVPGADTRTGLFFVSAAFGIPFAPAETQKRRARQKH